LEAISLLANQRKIQDHFRTRDKLTPRDTEILAAIYLLSLGTQMPKAKNIADYIDYHKDLIYTNLSKLVKKRLIEKHKSAAYNLKGVPGFGVTYVYSLHGKGFEILMEYQRLVDKYKKL
jgi:predicted transcriptional regulator